MFTLKFHRGTGLLTGKWNNQTLQNPTCRVWQHEDPHVSNEGLKQQLQELLENELRKLRSSGQANILTNYYLGEYYLHEQQPAKYILLAK